MASRYTQPTEEVFFHLNNSRALGYQVLCVEEIVFEDDFGRSKKGIGRAESDLVLDVRHAFHVDVLGLSPYSARSAREIYLLI